MPRFQVIGFSVDAADQSAGFLDEQDAGGDVPEVQIQLPEAVQPAGCHIGQIQRGAFIISQ